MCNYGCGTKDWVLNNGGEWGDEGLTPEGTLSVEPIALQIREEISKVNVQVVDEISYVA